MWLCIFSGSQFEETFDNTPWRKANKCNQCDYASSQASNLRTHLKTHSGEKLNNCDQCDFACWLRTHLKSHSGWNVAKQLLDWPRIKHDNSTAYLVLWLYTMEKRKTNAAIVTVSSYASALNRHWKTHTGERPNKCNQCDYATSCADVLKTHLKTHSGERPNKCNQCDFASSRAEHLRTHLKIHSGEKDNKCDQCTYASSGPSNLRKHYKIHTR